MLDWTWPLAFSSILWNLFISLKGKKFNIVQCQITATELWVLAIKSVSVVWLHTTGEWANSVQQSQTYLTKQCWAKGHTRQSRSVHKVICTNCWHYCTQLSREWGNMKCPDVKQNEKNDDFFVRLSLEAGLMIFARIQPWRWLGRLSINCGGWWSWSGPLARVKTKACNPSQGMMVWGTTLDLEGEERRTSPVSVCFGWFLPSLFSYTYYLCLICFSALGCAVFSFLPPLPRPR